MLTIGHVNGFGAMQIILPKHSTAVVYLTHLLIMYCLSPVA